MKKSVKKVVIVAIASLAAAPAFAKTSLSALALPSAKSSSLGLTSLPLFTQTYSFSGPGFGKAKSSTVLPVLLPGLGTFTSSYDNGGKGNTATLDLSFTNSATSGASTLPPLKFSYTYDGVGFGKGSNPTIKPIALGLLGTIDASFDNTGKGGTTTFSYSYVNTTL